MVAGGRFATSFGLFGREKRTPKCRPAGEALICLSLKHTQKCRPAKGPSFVDLRANPSNIVLISQPVPVAQTHPNM